MPLRFSAAGVLLIVSAARAGICFYPLRSELDFAMNSIVKIGLALGVFLSPALPAEAAPIHCAAQVDERWDHLGVSPSVIRDIYYEAQHHLSRKTDRRAGFLAWVNLHSCLDDLVIDMSRH